MSGRITLRPDVRIVEATDELLGRFIPAAWRMGEASNLIGLLRQAMVHKGSRAIGMLIDGWLVGIGGVGLLNPTLGWAMFMPGAGVGVGEWARGLPPLVRWLDDLQAHGVRRVEANINAAFPEAHVTAMALGFRYAGDRDGWDGVDRPTMVYARMRPWPIESLWTAECRRALHLARLREHCPAIVERVARWKP